MASQSISSAFPSLLNHPVGAEEIVDIYRIAFGRPPESVEVIDYHLSSNRTIASFLELVVESEEFKTRYGGLSPHDAAGSQALTRRVDVDADPDQLRRLLEHDHDVWTRQGDHEPFWSVLTADTFLRESFDASTESDFYETGAGDADVLVTATQRNGVDLPTDGSIVDLGCGVGRVGEHLSKIFRSYEGVDISESHLKLARDRFMRLGRANARFSTLSDFVDGDGRYDCVYSILVLQHTQPPIMKMLLEKLLSSLNPGGVGLFQLPCACADYEFDLSNYLGELPERDAMEMHALPQHVVFDTIQSQGCRLVESIEDGRIAPLARSFTFLVQRR